MLLPDIHVPLKFLHLWRCGDQFFLIICLFFCLSIVLQHTRVSQGSFDTAPWALYTTQISLVQVLRFSSYSTKLCQTNLCSREAGTEGSSLWEKNFTLHFTIGLVGLQYMPLIRFSSYYAKIAPESSHVLDGPQLGASSPPWTTATMRQCRSTCPASFTVSGVVVSPGRMTKNHRQKKKRN